MRFDGIEVIAIAGGIMMGTVLVIGFSIAGWHSPDAILKYQRLRDAGVPIMMTEKGGFWLYIKGNSIHVPDLDKVSK